MPLELDFLPVQDFRFKIYQTIKIYLDKNSQNFGKLIQRKDLLGIQNIWHYSVIISNEYAVSWGPINRDPLCLGEITLHSIDWQNFDFTKHYEITDKDSIVKRIYAAIQVFHGQWLYGLWGFNCEHFSRLIVSGCPDSYQVKENILISIIPGAVFTNHEAYRQLYSAISKLDKS